MMTREQLLQRIMELAACVMRESRYKKEQKAAVVMYDDAEEELEQCRRQHETAE